MNKLTLTSASKDIVWKTVIFLIYNTLLLGNMKKRVAVASVGVSKEDKAGIEILDCIFPHDNEVDYAKTKFPGIIIILSSLDPLEVIGIIKKCFISLAYKIVPIQLWVKASPEIISEACVRVARGLKVSSATFRVEGVRRGRVVKSRSEVVRRIADGLISELGWRVSIEDPQYIVDFEILGEEAGVCVVSRNLIWKRKDYLSSV